MPIVRIPASSVQEYLAREPSAWLEGLDLSCPECGGPTASKGSYSRGSDDETGQRVKLVIPRRICRLCRKSFGLLPAFLAPYQQFSLPTQERAVAAVVSEGRSVTEAAAEIPAPSGPVHPRTLRRWIGRLGQQSRSCLAALARAVHLGEAPSPEAFTLAAGREPLRLFLLYARAWAEGRGLGRLFGTAIGALNLLAVRPALGGPWPSVTFVFATSPP